MRKVDLSDPTQYFQKQIQFNSYNQGLQFLRCFEHDPGNPKAAAILSLVFLQAGKEGLESLEYLQGWLHSFIEAFIDENPRDQSDQTEKILAVGIYLNIYYKTGYDTFLHLPNLISYVNYAEHQNWLKDPFLAFYCYQFCNDLDLCKTGQNYFLSNYERFLSRENISNVCQSLITIGIHLDEIDIEKGYKTIEKKLNEQENNFSELCWVIWAYSNLVNQRNSDFTNKITDIIEARLQNFYHSLIQNSDFYVLLAESWLNRELRTSTQKSRQIHDEKSLRLDLTLDELGLAMISMVVAKKHTIYAINESEKNVIVELFGKINKQKNSLLSKSELILINFITITATVIVSFLVDIYLYGQPQMTFSLDSSKLLFNSENGLYYIGVITLLLSEILAIKDGKTAAYGLLAIPLINRFSTLWQRRNHNAE